MRLDQWGRGAIVRISLADTNVTGCGKSIWRVRRGLWLSDRSSGGWVDQFRPRWTRRRRGDVRKVGNVLSVHDVTRVYGRLRSKLKTLAHLTSDHDVKTWGGFNSNLPEENNGKWSNQNILFVSFVYNKRNAFSKYSESKQKGRLFLTAIECFRKRASSSSLAIGSL